MSKGAEKPKHVTPKWLRKYVSRVKKALGLTAWALDLEIADQPSASVDARAAMHCSRPEYLHAILSWQRGKYEKATTEAKVDVIHELLHVAHARLDAHWDDVRDHLLPKDVKKHANEQYLEALEEYTVRLSRAIYELLEQVDGAKVKVEAPPEIPPWKLDPAIVELPEAKEVAPVVDRNGKPMEPERDAPLLNAFARLHVYGLRMEVEPDGSGGVVAPNGATLAIFTGPDDLPMAVMKAASDHVDAEEKRLRSESAPKGGFNFPNAANGGLPTPTLGSFPMTERALGRDAGVHAWNTGEIGNLTLPPDRTGP